MKTQKTQHRNPVMVQCVCGSTLFFRCYRNAGWWNQTVEANAEGGVDVVDTDVDSVRNGSEPKTMVCCGCGTRVRNPDANSRDPKKRA